LYNIKLVSKKNKQVHPQILIIWCKILLKTLILAENCKIFIIPENEKYFVTSL